MVERGLDTENQNRAFFSSKKKQPSMLSQKNCLVKNLKRFRKQLEREAGKLEATKCAFIPKTFKMPSECYLLVEEFRKNPGIAWLLKPSFFTGKLVSPDDWQCQFDKSARTEAEMSVLVLLLAVECWQPFFFLGFAEHVHLTNVAVQKAACGYDPGKARDTRCLRTVPPLPATGALLADARTLTSSCQLPCRGRGCKRVIQQLGQHPTAKRGAGSVDVCGYGQRFHPQPPERSEGDYRWLLEVNAASASLTASSQEDCELKCHLLKDTLHTVDREGRQAKMLTGKEKRVGGFDPIRNDRPVSRGGDLGTPVDGNGMANAHFVLAGCSARVPKLAARQREERAHLSLENKRTRTGLWAFTGLRDQKEQMLSKSGCTPPGCRSTVKNKHVNGVGTVLVIVPLSKR
ncbi:hypothetical protein QYF61_012178 [Mycteria americana]|uniref:Uncharacterized protein n=1 Tax=Mycteria americana TaxID=33587 RepID=A0AAN7MMG1_MYCAM|nr:hypothetical protein QYF61_012178 [Mycteria americana]